MACVHVGVPGEEGVVCGTGFQPIPRGATASVAAVPMAWPRLGMALVLTLLLWRPLAAQVPSWQPVYDGFLEGRQSLLYTGGMAYCAPNVVDVDADGDPDILLSDQWHRLWLLRNDGTASSAHFTLVTRNVAGLGDPPPASYPTYYLKCAFGDFDADGDTDMVESSYQQRNLNFWRNTGDRRNFQLQQEASGILSASFGDNGAPACGDLDGDGDLDIVVGCNEVNAGRVWFYRNTGTPTVPAFTTRSSVFYGSGLHQVCPALADIDGDGDLDLFVGTQDGHVRFLRNTGSATTPTFTSESTDYLPNPWNAYRSCLAPALHDLDGDGDLDALVARIDGQVEVWMNRGDAGAADWACTGGLLDALDFFTGRKPAFVDIDNDGDLDLFVGSDVAPNTGNLSFYRNRGGPGTPSWHLETAQLLTDGPGPEYPTGIHNVGLFLTPTFHDIDGDGDQDLFAGTWNKSQSGDPEPLLFFENVSAGSTISFVFRHASYLSRFPGAAPLPPAADWTCPAFADIDDNGKMDLFLGTGDVSNPGTGSIYRYEDTGGPGARNWVFRSSQFMGLTFGTAACPTFHDVDGDGLLDLLVGDNRDGVLPRQIAYYRNAGTATAPVFGPVPTDPAFAPVDLHNLATVGFADLDGDGHDDLVLSDEDAGIQLFLDARPDVTVLPRMMTVLAGEAVDFITSSTVVSPTWSLHRNASGGSITGSGHYVAGPTTGARDDIQVLDGATGEMGRAFVNVISPADATSFGKAIIVAGRHSADPLWPSTNYLANYTFNALRYRGLSRDSIQYLSPDPSVDADGDGQANDVDDPSTLANVHAALAGFAGGASQLFVYLIDHGEDPGNNPSIRCNESEVLSGTQLDAWLDEFQASWSVRVTLVVDACQSGGFLDKCVPTGAQERICISSTDHGRPAYFSAGGQISFSHVFATELFEGATIATCFGQAEGAMSSYQPAQLDDDGDGVWRRGIDGDLAGQTTIGAAFVAGADRPVIGSCTPNQGLAGGLTSALLWAGDVSAPCGVDRVWATIASPEARAGNTADPATPVTGLPEIELVYNPTSRHYEGTYTQFHSLGTHGVSIYARDASGEVSYPKQTYVHQGLGSQRFIIVAGNAAFDADSPVENCQFLGSFAHDIALARQLGESDITFLTSGASSGADGLPSEGAVAAALGAAAGARQVTLALVGGGSAAGYDINGNGADTGDITSTELDGWLDSLQGAPGTRVVVVLDFPGAGSWLSNLTPPAGRERVVITSSSQGETPWCEAGGTLSFSRWFLGNVFAGVNVRDAYRSARTAIRAVTLFSQTPALDDDGNGNATTTDGPLAASTYIGAAFVTGAEGPVIGDWPRAVVTDSGPQALWVANVTSAAGVSGVTAYIVPPGTTPASSGIISVPLVRQANNSRWEATQGGLDPLLAYNVVYVAQGGDGVLSEPVRSVYSINALDDDYDRFYGDETAGTLNFLSLGAALQHHALARATDEDWVVFNADPAGAYDINLLNMGPLCDAQIDVYRGRDLVFVANEPITGTLSLGPGTVPVDQPLYVRVSHNNPGSTFFGEGTEYDLQVFFTGGGNAGLPTIGGSRTRLRELADTTISCDPGGVYPSTRLLVPAGALSRDMDIILDDPGDLGTQPYFPATQAWLSQHATPGSFNGSVTRFYSEGPVTFTQPASLTMQFLNDGPTVAGLAIDDVPPGSPTSALCIQQWDGAGWVVVPGPQTLVGDTISVPISSLGSGLFAVGTAPSTSGARECWLGLE